MQTENAEHAMHMLMEDANRLKTMIHEVEEKEKHSAWGLFYALARDREMQAMMTTIKELTRRLSTYLHAIGHQDETQKQQLQALMKRLRDAQTYNVRLDTALKAASHYKPSKKAGFSTWMGSLAPTKSNTDDTGGDELVYIPPETEPVRIDKHYRTTNKTYKGPAINGWYASKSISLAALRATMGLGGKGKSKKKKKVEDDDDSDE